MMHLTCAIKELYLSTALKSRKVGRRVTTVSVKLWPMTFHVSEFAHADITLRIATCFRFGAHQVPKNNNARMRGVDPGERNAHGFGRYLKALGASQC